MEVAMEPENSAERESEGAPDKLPDQAEPEHKVGYRQPPKRTQFKRGHSGNPRGRPPSKGGFKGEILEEIAEKVAIREQGVQKKVTKFRAALKSLVANAVHGDPRSTKLLIDCLSKVAEDEPAVRPVTTQAIAEEDRAIIERFLQRETQKKTGL
jgi:hypothetical protein